MVGSFWVGRLRGEGSGLISIVSPEFMFAVDESQLVERMGRISERQLGQLFAKLDLALGRSGG